jgi:hypothetical protein
MNPFLSKKNSMQMHYYNHNCHLNYVRTTTANSYLQHAKNILINRKKKDRGISQTHKRLNKVKIWRTDSITEFSKEILNAKIFMPIL